jgi:hypothetical protein
VAVSYFDYEEVAREARIPAEKLEVLRRLIKREFPRDEMMYELHLLRACMAIKEDVVTIDQALTHKQRGSYA